MTPKTKLSDCARRSPSCEKLSASATSPHNHRSHSSLQATRHHPSSTILNLSPISPASLRVCSKKNTSAKSTALQKTLGPHSAPTKNSSKLSSSNASAESEMDPLRESVHNNTPHARPMFWPESWTTPNSRPSIESIAPRSSTHSAATDQRTHPSKTAS